MNRLHGPRRPRVRPAPPGAWPSTSRSDAPPDGWRHLHASGPERISTWVDRALLNVVDWAAREVTRRQFLRYAARAGTVVIAATAGMLVGPIPAYGVTCQGGNACEPCGPSPLCNKSLGDCDDAQKNCKHAPAQGKSRREYGGTRCVSGTTANWWIENCCVAKCQGTWKYAYIKCADCCSINATGDRCGSNCPSGSRKCICRYKNSDC